MPDDRLISAVLTQVLPETREEQAHYNLVWLYGLRLFNCGYFWEACEVLEPVWERAEQNSRERFLLQAVIHLADAALQCELGNERQCARQCDLARLCIEHCFADNRSSLMGLADREVIFAIEQVESGSTEIWLQHAL